MLRGDLAHDKLLYLKIKVSHGVPGGQLDMSPIGSIASREKGGPTTSC